MQAKSLWDEDPYRPYQIIPGCLVCSPPEPRFDQSRNECQERMWLKGYSRYLKKRSK